MLLNRQGKRSQKKCVNRFLPTSDTSETRLVVSYWHGESQRARSNLNFTRHNWINKTKYNLPACSQYRCQLVGPFNYLLQLFSLLKRSEILLSNNVWNVQEERKEQHSGENYCWRVRGAGNSQGVRTCGGGVPMVVGKAGSGSPSGPTIPARRRTAGWHWGQPQASGISLGLEMGMGWDRTGHQPSGWAHPGPTASPSPAQGSGVVAQVRTECWGRIWRQVPRLGWLGQCLPQHCLVIFPWPGGMGTPLAVLILSWPPAPETKPFWGDTFRAPTVSTELFWTEEGISNAGFSMQWYATFEEFASVSSNAT